jgi:galactokinase/mevalonate kinase-like predicted kinase
MTMKMNNTISLTLITLLTLGAGTALATSTEATEMMKTQTMDAEMKTETMEKMDEMNADAMKKMDEMSTETMEKMDGEMNKDHKKKDMMES